MGPVNRLVGELASCSAPDSSERNGFSYIYIHTYIFNRGEVVCLSCKSPNNSDGDHVRSEDVVDNLWEFLAFFFRDRDNYPVIQDPDVTTDPDDVCASLCFGESHLKAQENSK